MSIAPVLSAPPPARRRRATSAAPPQSHSHALTGQRSRLAVLWVVDLDHQAAARVALAEPTPPTGRLAPSRPAPTPEPDANSASRRAANAYASPERPTPVRVRTVPKPPGEWRSPAVAGASAEPARLAPPRSAPTAEPGAGAAAASRRVTRVYAVPERLAPPRVRLVPEPPEQTQPPAARGQAGPVRSRIRLVPDARAASARAVGPARTRLTRRGRHVLGGVAILLGLAIGGGAAAAAAQFGRPTPPLPNSVPPSVVVMPGDTLWTIAERLAPGRDPRGVVTEIRQLNALPSADVRAGQRLRLRAP